MVRVEYLEPPRNLKAFCDCTLQWEGGQRPSSGSSPATVKVLPHEEQVPSISLSFRPGRVTSFGFRTSTSFIHRKQYAMTAPVGPTDQRTGLPTLPPHTAQVPENQGRRPSCTIFFGFTISLNAWQFIQSARSGLEAATGTVATDAVAGI